MNNTGSIETGVFSEVIAKLDDPCWLVSVLVIVLALGVVRMAHSNAKEEGARAIQMLHVALNQHKENKNG